MCPQKVEEITKIKAELNELESRHAVTQDSNTHKFAL